MYWRRGRDGVVSFNSLTEWCDSDPDPNFFIFLLRPAPFSVLIEMQTLTLKISYSLILLFKGLSRFGAWYEERSRIRIRRNWYRTFKSGSASLGSTCTWIQYRYRYTRNLSRAWILEWTNSVSPKTIPLKHVILNIQTWSRVTVGRVVVRSSPVP